MLVSKVLGSMDSISQNRGSLNAKAHATPLVTLLQIGYNRDEYPRQQVGSSGLPAHSATRARRRARARLIRAPVQWEGI